MLDPKGGTLSESTHVVKTLAKGIEWFPGCTEDDVPLKIKQFTTSGGRLRVEIYNHVHDLLATRG